MARPEVIALFGPTAVGKTEVAIALARALRERDEQPVAVSADALQVYAGLERLTGVADSAQRAALEHRLVGFRPVTETFSAGAYARLAHAEIDGLLAEGRRPIVLGGTGLYLRAALTDLALHPAADPALRARRSAELAERGAPALHAELSARAPWAAAGIAPGDGHRLVRALELADAGRLVPREGRSQLWTGEMRRSTLLVGLQRERAELYARIDARALAMLAAGAREEVLAADRAGASATARRALGFRELLAGDVEAMQRNTRRYARRQLTWMRKLSAVHHLGLTGVSAQEAAERILMLWTREAG